MRRDAVDHFTDGARPEVKGPYNFVPVEEGVHMSEILEKTVNAGMELFRRALARVFPKIVD